MVITATDAPLSNLLSAKVTISAVSLSGDSGNSSAAVMTQPITVDFANLGAVQEPMKLSNIALGTYTKATVTVTAAQVSYVDTTGAVITADATVASPPLPSL